MKKNQDNFFSWRLKLILVLGCLGGLVLGLFSLHVASMPDAQLGPTPPSWSFKSTSGRVAAAFEKGSVMQEQFQLTVLMTPAIDQAVPDETEFALFALG